MGQDVEHRQFTGEDAAAIVSQIPPEWLLGDERAALQGYLLLRAAKAADILQSAYPTAGEEAA